MPDDASIKGFPDISAKLAAPTKKSLFERQKAEAEAKRARERAETAAVYEDFVKSFDEDPQNVARSSNDSRPATVGRSSGPGGGPAKRHFTSSGPRSSGPGTLGPAPSLLSRKRTHDGFPQLHRNRESAQGVLAFENPAPGTTAATAAFRTSDDENERDAETKEAERAAAKPTLYLASLPPTISPTAIKALIPPTLTVDNVKILRPTVPATTTERRSVSAIVTLANESAASDIDSSVSSLQNRYLGWGHYLSISRHLSSAAISSTVPMAVGGSSTASHPFGAKPIPQQFGGSLNRAPPPGARRGGFAPPAAYGSSFGRSVPGLQVEVTAPSDLKQLKLIHMTLESLLNYGPEFEALLMSRPEVQKEEKWAWLWDPRSVGGVYYRWKLWDTLTNAERGRNQRGKPGPSVVFETGAKWVAPESSMKFEYATHLDEFVSDDDYNSSEEEQSDGEDERRNLGGAPPSDALTANSDGVGYLNPLQKAKLTHLLARLPTSHARLRRGDVARVTAFAIEHAGAGADEVVELIVQNVLSPIAYSGANPEREREKASSAKPEASEQPTSAQDTTEDGISSSTKGKPDHSAAKLVGLYIISDILSSSATSGVRHAWRYRQLFEAALKAHNVFEHLGRQEKDLRWGRLKAEKWKRSVGALLHLWEGWCVFPQSSQERFVDAFEKPPLTEEEKAEETARAEAERTAAANAKSKSRWKAVEEDANAGKFDPSRVVEGGPGRVHFDSQPSHGPNDSVDGEPMSDIDGVPMEDSDLEMTEDEPADDTVSRKKGDNESQDMSLSKMQCPEARAATEQPERQPLARKPRPKAEDMFAGSDTD